MNLRHLMCYVCRKPFYCRGTPDKCRDCGESLFINLVYLGEAFHLEYLPEEEIPVSDESNENAVDTYSILADNDYNDYEDDVDAFAEIERDELMVYNLTTAPGNYSVRVMALGVVGFKKNTACVILIRDHLNNLIKRIRCGFSQETGYNNSGIVIYGTDKFDIELPDGGFIQAFFDRTILGWRNSDIEIKRKEI